MRTHLGSEQGEFRFQLFGDAVLFSFGGVDPVHYEPVRGTGGEHKDERKQVEEEEIPEVVGKFRQDQPEQESVDAKQEQQGEEDGQSVPAILLAVCKFRDQHLCVEVEESDPPQFGEIADGFEQFKGGFFAGCFKRAEVRAQQGRESEQDQPAGDVDEDHESVLPGSGGLHAYEVKTCG